MAFRLLRAPLPSLHPSRLLHPPTPLILRRYPSSSSSSIWSTEYWRKKCIFFFFSKSIFKSLLAAEHSRRKFFSLFHFPFFPLFLYYLFLFFHISYLSSLPSSSSSTSSFSPLLSSALHLLFLHQFYSHSPHFALGYGQRPPEWKMPIIMWMSINPFIPETFPSLSLHCIAWGPQPMVKRYLKHKARCKQWVR